MDKFLTKNDSLTAVKIKAADRVRQYLEGTLHADDGLLLCSTCNVVIDHLRKHKIDKHLESSYHTLKAKTSVWKQQTLKTVLNCKCSSKMFAAENYYLLLKKIVKDRNLALISPGW